MARSDVMSRSDLAAKTQLPRSTLVSAITSLLARGLISGTDGLTKGPGAGRPSHQIRLTLADKRLLFVDIDPTSPQMTLATCRGDIGPSSDVDETFVFADERSAPPSATDLDPASALRFQALARAHSVDAVVVAVPGATRATSSGRAIPKSPSSPSVSGVPVAVETYANLAAMGEAWFGTTKSATNAVYVSARAMVGVGLTLDGRLLRSGSVTNADLARLSSERQAEWRVLHDPALVRAQGPDSTREHAAVNFGRAVGETISNLVTTMEPDTMVIDGALGDVAQLVADTISAELGYRSRLRSDQLPHVRPSDLGADAAAFGAVALFRDRRLAQLAPAFHSPTVSWSD